MASNIMLLLAIVAHTIYTVNSMPSTKDLLALDSSISPPESTLNPEVVKLSKDHSQPIVSSESKQQRVDESSTIVEKRSVQQEDKKPISETEKIAIGVENHDDLETAAGTNILRPLFVYRQQLAYRERVKKAGRRAVPNF